MNKILSENYEEKIKSFQSDKLLQRVVLAWEYVKDNPLYDLYSFEEFLKYLENNQYDELHFILEYYKKEIEKEIEEIKEERNLPCKCIVSRSIPIIKPHSYYVGTIKGYCKKEI